MAFWYRINPSKLKLLSHQFKRCYYVQTPYFSLLNYTSKPSNSCTLENPVWDICKKPTDFCNSARFFVTSFQAKAKKEDKGNDGPRLNQEITAQFVRLVTDEGHGIVPLREALKQARNLKLDLVEVQGNVDPPVCKLMDFHKEKYKRHMKEKDRAKSKSEVTIRKGDCKEVRFSDKTEQKDLQMKADTVIRLMQRGYRVKCMVTGSRKSSGRASLKKGYSDEDLTEEEIAERRRQEEEEEKEELKALLSGLIALIEDECFVETGPRVEKKQAYVIVRHVKFGPSKKGSAKKLKVVEKAASAQLAGNHSGPIGSALMTEEDPAESDTETEERILSDEDDLPDKELKDDKPAWSVHSIDDFDRVFDLSNNAKELGINRTEEMNDLPGADSPQMNLKIPNLLHPRPAPPGADSSQMNYKIPNLSYPRPAHDAKQAYIPPYSPQPSPAAENRYKRNGPVEHRGPDKTGSFRLEPQLSRQSGNTESQINVTPSMGERNPIRTDSSAFRNIKPPPTEMLKHPSHPPAAGTQASSYGIFSSPKATTPGNQGAAAEVNNNREGNLYNSGKNSSAGGFGANPRFSNSKSDDDNRQGRWGIFSSDCPNANTNRMSK